MLYDLVERKEGRRVDVEREQVADRVLVLLTVQPMRRNGPRPALLRGRFVERALEPCDEARHLVLARALGLRRRHQPAAELADGLLERRGMLGDLVARDAVEREVTRELDLVVTLRAIALDRPPMLLAGFGDRGVAADPSASCRKHQRREQSRLSDHGLGCHLRLSRLYAVVHAQLTGPITHRATDRATCFPSSGR